MSLPPHLQALPLPPSKLTELAQNTKLTSLLSTLLSTLTNNTPTNIQKKEATLIYEFATSILTHTPARSTNNNNNTEEAKIIHEIVAGTLASREQVTEAWKYRETHTDTTFDEEMYKRMAGIGIEPSETELVEFVQKNQTIANMIREMRYKALQNVIREIKNDEVFKWTSGQIIKNVVDKEIVRLCGPKDERDLPPPKVKKEEKPKDAPVPKKTVDIRPYDPKANLAFVKEGDLSRHHKPGGNPQIDPRLIEEHLKRTGGKVITRFPPEPNGFLHIGHAKAINVNFCYALAHGGDCNLRFDDTNPCAEEEVYFKSIEDTVKWLGFTPTRITYSSTHFQKLYDLAEQMITIDKAYVCECTADEMKADRGDKGEGVKGGVRKNCRHHGRPAEESMKLFREMKDGKWPSNSITLRMKMDMENPNPQFWDLVAYRVLHAAHHRTGNDWCIYPTYDYTHCLVDSFEDITHSMCTTEFVASRESYYWLCDVLKVYKPVQWEYGRLAITNTVLSKRKIAKLVESKIVEGWDDPRLYTLPALKKRGFPAEAINQFVRELGVTTTTSTIQVGKLESAVRTVLDIRCARRMAVVEPLRVTISNWSEVVKTQSLKLTVANSPKDPNAGSRDIILTSELYIEASDFREDTGDKSFYRLTPKQTIGLLHAPAPIEFVLVNERNEDGSPRSITCAFVTTPLKPKTWVQWVAVHEDSTGLLSSPIPCTINLYGNLFAHENPHDAEGGFLADITPDKGLTVKQGFVEAALRLTKQEPNAERVVYQFLRNGYFCVDTVGDSNRPWIFNRTVTLKEDSEK